MIRIAESFAPYPVGMEMCYDSGGTVRSIIAADGGVNVLTNKTGYTYAAYFDAWPVAYNLNRTPKFDIGTAGSTHQFCMSIRYRVNAPGEDATLVTAKLYIKNGFPVGTGLWVGHDTTGPYIILDGDGVVSSPVYGAASPVDNQVHSLRIRIMRDKMYIKFDNEAEVEGDWSFDDEHYTRRTIFYSKVWLESRDADKIFFQYFDLLMAHSNPYSTDNALVQIDGAAVPGADVYLFDTATGTLKYSLTTDEDGNIDYSTVVNDEYYIVVMDDLGYSFSTIATVGEAGT